MLNFTIKPGECFTIGEDITVVVLGGTQNNIKIMVDAPKSYNIVRGRVLEKNAAQEKQAQTRSYYPEPAIAPEDMRRLIASQRRRKSGGQ